jgi:hypothetical protein
MNLQTKAFGKEAIKRECPCRFFCRMIIEEYSGNFYFVFTQ